MTNKAIVETEVEPVLAPAIETEHDDDEEEFTLLGKPKDNLSSINTDEEIKHMNINRTDDTLHEIQTMEMLEDDM